MCVVALCIEATLQQRLPLNNPLYLVLAFCCTVVYYSKAYIKTEISEDRSNLRSLWYSQHKRLMFYTQIFLLIIISCAALYFVANYFQFMLALSVYEYALLLVFPLVSVLYYGIQLSAGSKNYNLRNIGWLKPFIIGFIWAGLTNIYPVLYSNIEQGIHYQFTYVGVLLFVKNVMYITVLCIMFDIKDYAMDYNQQLKTFVVKAGLRNTIFYIIIPLTLLGLTSFIGFAFLQHFSTLKILLNTIPFLLVLSVAYSLQTRRSIFYYLVIIDGLMLVKAVCGSIAMTYF